VPEDIITLRRPALERQLAGGAVVHLETFLAD
jgi:hypothetical protein